MKLSRSTWDRIRDVAVEKNDKEIALMLRERNAGEVADLTDEQLQAAVKQAREAAVSFGIRDRRLRMRFIMLGVVRLPRFWLDPTIAGLLNAPTGTPEMRFGDICAMFKMSALRANRPDGVWW